MLGDRFRTMSQCPSSKAPFHGCPVHLPHPLADGDVPGDLSKRATHLFNRGHSDGKGPAPSILREKLTGCSEVSGRVGLLTSRPAGASILRNGIEALPFQNRPLWISNSATWHQNRPAPCSDKERTAHEERHTNRHPTGRRSMPSARCAGLSPIWSCVRADHAAASANHPWTESWHRYRVGILRDVDHRVPMTCLAMHPKRLHPIGPHVAASHRRNDRTVAGHRLFR